jgi:hypothetical protein
MSFKFINFTKDESVSYSRNETRAALGTVEGDFDVIVSIGGLRVVIFGTLYETFDASEAKVEATLAQTLDRMIQVGRAHHIKTQGAVRLLVRPVHADLAARRRFERRHWSDMKGRRLQYTR